MHARWRLTWRARRGGSAAVGGGRGGHPRRQRRAAGLGRLDTYTQEQIDRALNVNLRAPIALAHALAPAMVARGRGHLLFVSSLSGKGTAPTARSTAPRSSACAVSHWRMREDLRASGVGVSAVLPGFIRDAGMFADVGVSCRPGVGMRTPEHVAKAVVRAIERNRAEVDIAPISLRVGSALAWLAPELSARSRARPAPTRSSPVSPTDRAPSAEVSRSPVRAI